MDFNEDRKEWNSLREAREALGVSQEELARRVDITQGNLSRIERGRRNPTVKTLERLAEALGCVLDLVWRRKE